MNMYTGKHGKTITGLAPEASLVLVLILTAFLALVGSCKNPLVTTIEEEVRVTVTPPEVESVFPASDSRGVAITSKIISIDFSKPIMASSVSSSSITIEDSQGTKLSGVWNVNEKSLTFTSNTDLAYGETYTITVTTGVMDTDGNPISSAFSWTFTTGIAPDTTPPVIDAITINEGANGLHRWN